MKTKDAFAFRVLDYGMEIDERAAEMYRQGDYVTGHKLSEQALDLLVAPFQHKEEKEPYETDRVKGIEQSLREIERDRRRVNFLLKCIDNHDRRLKKILASSRPLSPRRQRAEILKKKYRQVRDLARSYLKMLAGMEKDNKKTMRVAFNEELGNRLRLARRRRGFTQSIAARMFGVTRVAYSRYETGRREMPPLFIYQAAAAFDVTTDYLLGRSEL